MIQRLYRWLQFIDIHQLAVQRFTDTHKRCGRDGLILAERARFGTEIVTCLGRLAESDGGCVLKDDKACSVEEATVPNQDDLPFDGCEGDVLMCLFVQDALEDDSVLLVRIGLLTACAPTVIFERCSLGWTQMSMPLLTVSFVDHGGR